MMDYSVSVAMTVCNGERFIKPQLDSIVGQSRRPDEIIICDDSDNDNTREAIAEIITENSDIIKYFKNDVPLGVSKNFEKAISLTSGDIIFLSDQDDIWSSDKIDQLCSLIAASPECGGAFCNSELVDTDLTSLRVTHFELRGFDGNDSADLSFFLKRVPAAGHNMAFKKEFKELLLPFPELNECHDTWIGLVIAAVAGWTFTAESLTEFRQHENNLSQAGRKSQLQAALASVKNNTFSWNASLYNELIKRLADRVTPEILELLRDRRDHSTSRAQMNCNIFRRLSLIFREIWNRRYFKYGRGWKNVIQDLVFRGI